MIIEPGNSYNAKIFLKFENKEEIDIYCRFFYNNDFFLRKAYKNLDLYKEYINTAIRAHGRIYTDNTYHYRLAMELFGTIDKFKRKYKLKYINNL